MSETASDEKRKDERVFNTRGGPHDLGDPDDRSLRKVEIEIIIPKKMRQRAKTEKCGEEVGAFGKCCTESGFFMFAKCRPENNLMKECLGRWYNDAHFRKECEEEYLNERSEYRRTGIKQNMKKF